LIAVYHQIKEFPRTGKRGRPRQPVLEPHPELVYAQVVKEKKQGRLKSLTKRICCGPERLARLGLKISASLIEPKLVFTFAEIRNDRVLAADRMAKNPSHYVCHRPKPRELKKFQFG
jgi:hypothetical protein